MERTVHPGEFYRHFKNKLYQIITVAIHSETAEEMVVYQALYGDFKTYVRPLPMFLSEVDFEKYPDCGQTYRFERVDLSALPAADRSAGMTAERPVGAMADRPVRSTAEADGGPATEAKPNPRLMQFLEAETLEEKISCLDILAGQAGQVGQVEIDSIYLVLDMKPECGTISEQIAAIRRYLNMQKHFSGGHLR